MSVRERIRATPLFWRVNLFVAAVLLFVVLLAEGILEPLAEMLITDIYGEFQPWHEAVLWVLNITLSTLTCSYIISKALSNKLGNMTRVAKALAHGKLHARFRVNGNDKDDFDVLAQSFNEMAEAIEKQLSNERRLLADISHELRSPLARMSIAAELLPRRQGQEERESIMLRLDKEITRMNELVALLLAQARDNFLSLGVNQPLALDEILRELADDFTFQGEAQNKRVESTLQGSLRVAGNPLLLRRMFGNLLSNAMFYTPAGSKIDIAARAEGGRIMVGIRDYGPGVPEAELEDIFRAFYRVDNSRARTSGGGGLGLALVREAVIAHNGSVDAENAHPGLLVSIVLPALEETTL